MPSINIAWNSFLGQSVSYLQVIIYFYTNRTHFASRQLSKWVFFFLAYSHRNNIPPKPLFEAHYGGFLFLGSYSLTSVKSCKNA